jgi:Tfp pilus assembly protein PilE
MSAHRTSGISILEILLVIAILSIVFTIGFQAYPRDRILVNQAVERFERDLQRSRFNAISFNTEVVFEVTYASEGSATSVYRAVPDPAAVGVQRAAFLVDLEREGLGGVEIAPVGDTCFGPAGSGRWTFDARGVGRADGATRLTFQHARTGYAVSLCVNAYGRVERL